jgi:hypothetical protein
MSKDGAVLLQTMYKHSRGIAEPHTKDTLSDSTPWESFTNRVEVDCPGVI